MHTSWPRTNMTTNQGLAVFFGTFESVFIFFHIILNTLPKTDF